MVPKRRQPHHTLVFHSPQQRKRELRRNKNCELNASTQRARGALTIVKKKETQASNGNRKAERAAAIISGREGLENNARSSTPTAGGGSRRRRQQQWQVDHRSYRGNQKVENRGAREKRQPRWCCWEGELGGESGRA
jgi:hypothetical protein